MDSPPTPIVHAENKIIATSAAGFLIGSLFMARYKMNASVINSASTYGLAARAIGLGTLLSISSVGLLIGSSAKMLDIHSMSDLRLAVRNFMENADHDEYEFVLQPIAKK